MKTKTKTKPVRKGPAIKRGMYKIPDYRPSKFNINKGTEGEPIEVKIERMISNKEPIKDGAPLIFTERKEGVRASTNIRTDRFEVAIEATDKIAKSYVARREGKAKGETKGKDGEPESTQGKGTKDLPTDSK